MCEYPPQNGGKVPFVVDFCNHEALRCKNKFDLVVSPTIVVNP